MRTLLFFFLSTISLGAQNMVPNGGFEDYDSIPGNSGEWYKCKSWNNLSFEPDWPYGTPDYLSTKGENKARLPDCVFGHVVPHSGHGIMGFCNSYKETETDFREYVSNRLMMPMVVGNSYTVSFWVTNGEFNLRSCYGSDHFGVMFSDSLPVQMQHEAIGGVPQYEYQGELWSTTWKHIVFTFVADKPYEYITFGNFYADAETSCSLYGEDASQYGSYYFIDDVEIYSRAAF
jgi:hypothetical protein